jgi:hypothetical protein
VPFCASPDTLRLDYNRAFGIAPQRHLEDAVGGEWQGPGFGAGRLANPRSLPLRRSGPLRPSADACGLAAVYG